MAASHPYALLGGRQRLAHRNRLWLLATIAVFVCLTLWHLRPSPTSPRYNQKVSASTEQSGHAGGYKVLKNVGYHNGTFYFFNTTEPDIGTIMSGTTAIVSNKAFTADTYYPGMTLFLNEGATSDWNGLSHYYHFAVENILAGLAVLATVHDQPVMPDRLVVPWANWHDWWTVNEKVVGALFGKAVIEPQQWEQVTNGTSVFFEEMVLVDRWAAHRTDPEVRRWMKMPIVVFQDLINLGRPYFFDIARERIHSAFRTPRPKGERIAYIDRQRTNRKFPEAEHEEFVAAMHTLAKDRNVVFDHLVLEDMEPKEQVKRISQATILVGIHGNGLTHLLWLPPKSAVIELFMPLTFMRDYQCAAEVLGHDYTVIRGDAIYPRAEWEANTLPLNHTMLHSGQLVEVDVPLLVETVRDTLEARLGL